MKTVLLLLCGIFLVGATLSYAQDVYVIDEFEITMRSGPSIENKIIAMLPTGTKLHVIGEKEDWLLVQTLTGNQGWVLKRYMSADIPKKIVIKQLQTNYQEALKQLESETEKASRFEQANRELHVDFNQSQKNLERIKQDYTRLVEESKDFLKLKKENIQNLAQFKKTASELGQIRKQYDQLRSSNNIMWFLSGAAVVIISWLTGYVMGRIKRRSQSRSLYG